MAPLLRGRQQSSWCRGLDGWSPGVSDCPSRSRAVFLQDESCKDDGYWFGVRTAADCADRCAACPGCQEVIWSPFDQSCEIHRTLCNGSHLTDLGYGHCTATIAHINNKAPTGELFTPMLSQSGEKALRHNRAYLHSNQSTCAPLFRVKPCLNGARKRKLRGKTHLDT